MIDFHCHVDLYPDPHWIVRECTERRIYVLSVTNTPSTWAVTSALAKGAPRIRTAIGLHPQVVKERHREVELLTRHLPECRYVGEIGLDGSPEAMESMSLQEEVFSLILSECARLGGRVMSIHSRRASKRVLEHLAQCPSAGTPILHWFSGSKSEVAEAAGLGCWFSVGPAMILGERGRALVAEMPRDRILPESDGPFAMIEGRSANPWDAARVASTLAAAWETDVSSVWDVLRGNLARIGSIALGAGV